jgi:hypothetical protein
MADEEEKKLRVVDRRMFTAEGDLRPDFQPEEPVAAPPPPKPPPPPRSAAAAPPADAPPGAERGAGPGPERAESEPTSDFASIVRSLATTAYASLGLIPDPASGTRHREPAVARQMIDWLAVLEQKTRGNLTFEESDFLSRLLYELRLAFVEMTRSPAPKP